mmetsp:Transcript_7541/g.6882  ORF Transcript_7541/g.6882 Transcript_7541/m.6882 type:complete len:220 (+) Transcript_7541:2375-3034(+)
MYTILQEIEELEVTCNKLVEKSKKIQDYQKTLEMDVTAFDYVEEARVAMMYRSKLWKALKQWKELINQWKNSLFEDINVDEISVKSDLFTKTAIQCERQLPSHSTAVKHLKEIVFDFRETMPIVQALGNIRLELSHWEEIKKLLDIEDFPLEEKQFNLQQLISFKAAEKQEEIIEVSTTATQEYNLRQQVTVLKQQWHDQEFKVKAHKETFKLDQLLDF